MPVLSERDYTVICEIQELICSAADIIIISCIIADLPPLSC